MFIIYLIIFVGLFTTPLGILAFQREIRRTTNYWQIFNSPYRWNLKAALLFIMMIMFQITGMSFLGLLIDAANKINH